MKNIRRYRGRGLLFAGTALSIIVICTMGVLIRNASGSLIQGYHGQFGSKVTLTPDTAKTTQGKTKQSTAAHFWVSAEVPAPPEGRLYGPHVGKRQGADHAR